MNALWTWPEQVRGDLAPPADGVDCWSIPLAALPVAAEASAFALLSAEEQRRAGRFHFDRHRRSYVSSHAALRLLLARYLCIQPRSLSIVADENGRPILASPDIRLHFNLSHSFDVALVAVSRAGPVGVDVEAVREFPDFVEIARRYFASTEVENILRLSPDRRLAGFFATWTRKEAFVKALGLGLSFPLDAFSTGRPDGPPALTLADGRAAADWMLADLASSGEFRAALAIRGPEMAIDCRRASWSWLLDGCHLPALISARADSTAVRS